MSAKRTTIHVVDLQGLATLDALVEAIAAQLSPRGALSRITGTASRVQEVNVGGLAGVTLASPTAAVDPWTTLATHLEAALPRDEEGLLILALDEVPWWLDALEHATPGAARTALARLRRLRHEPRFARVRWIFTGSVGLAGRATDWGASAELNDLDVLVVPPLDPAAGATVFELECASRTSPAARALAHHEAGGLPHWIRVLAARCDDASEVDDGHVRSEVDRLLQPAFRHLFQEEGLGHFGRRYTPEERRIAGDILNVLCADDTPLPIRGVITSVLARDNDRTPATIEGLLWRLVDEFYLAPTPDTVAVQFSVPIFRRWWERWGHT